MLPYPTLTFMIFCPNELISELRRQSSEMANTSLMYERAEHGELIAKILQLVPDDLAAQIRKLATESKNARKEKLNCNAAAEQHDDGEARSVVVSAAEWDSVLARLDSLAGKYCFFSLLFLTYFVMVINTMFSNL